MSKEEAQAALSRLHEEMPEGRLLGDEDARTIAQHVKNLRMRIEDVRIVLDHLMN